MNILIATYNGSCGKTGAPIKPGDQVTFDPTIGIVRVGDPLPAPQLNAPSIAAEAKIINDPSTTMAEKVQAAAKIWQLAEDCQTALEPFKAEARRVAQAEGKPIVTIDGEGLTQCKVVFQTPTLKLKDGLDIEAEKRALGAHFGAVYEVKLALRKGNPSYLATFPQPVQAHVASVTTMVENTPRVSLKILSGVEEMK